MWLGAKLPLRLDVLRREPRRLRAPAALHGAVKRPEQQQHDQDTADRPTPPLG